MKGLRYTLLGDGPSDRLLDYPIRWALKVRGVRVEAAQWADLRRVRPKPSGLAARIQVTIDLFPSDLLFLHRDAENESREIRLHEIQQAVAELATDHVAIVPVRMTEAWFLHDEDAIRVASGNPNGRVPLSLPKPKRVERVVDPKATLFEALLTAANGI